MDIPTSHRRHAAAHTACVAGSSGGPAGGRRPTAETAPASRGHVPYEGTPLAELTPASPRPRLARACFAATNTGGVGRGLAAFHGSRHGRFGKECLDDDSLAASGVPHSTRHAGTAAERDASPADRQ